MGPAFGRTFAGLSTLFLPGGLKAPGTWGSAAGGAFAYFAMSGAPWWAYAAVSAFLVYFSVGVCDIGERFFGQKDPGRINFDEFAAMPVCYFGIFCGATPPGPLWAWAVAGFALFRFFDILKPLGISRIQTLDGGLGCVLDDAAAAAVSCAILNAAAFAVSSF